MKEKENNERNMLPIRQEKRNREGHRNSSLAFTVRTVLSDQSRPTILQECYQL